MKKTRKKRKTELDKLQIDMQGWNLVDNTTEETLYRSRSFKEDLKCCKEALSQMNFVYTGKKGKGMSAEQDQPFSMQAVMKSAAPFINNTVAKDTENNMQVDKTMNSQLTG
jgi:hypothetical protein